MPTAARSTGSALSAPRDTSLVPAEVDEALLLLLLAPPLVAVGPLELELLEVASLPFRRIALRWGGALASSCAVGELGREHANAPRNPPESRSSCRRC